MLWRCGSSQQAIVALPLHHVSQQSCVKGRDPITESLTLFEFESTKSLGLFIDENVNIFMQEQGLGVIWLLCSVLLSHGLQNVREEMDMPDTPLIGRFGY